jgi:hypothetical protein
MRAADLRVSPDERTLVGVRALSATVTEASHLCVFTLPKRSCHAQKAPPLLAFCDFVEWGAIGGGFGDAAILLGFIDFN